MILADAERVIEAAFPKQGVRIEHTAKGSFKVIKANGEVIGAAFDLTEAMKQACRPILKAEAQRRIDLANAQTEEFKDLIIFLKEKHAAEFNTWREERRAKAEAATSGATGAEPDSPQLVQVVSG